MDMQASSSEVCGEEAVRIRLGASMQTPPHVLESLALDPSLTVRAAVAMNRAATIETNLALAQDADIRVRSFLAQKLARLLPSLAPPEQSAAQDQVLSVLKILVEDEATRVRLSITECVKSLATVPRSLVLKLAQDQAVSVSEPIIRLSPLLSDHDLIALLTAVPHGPVARSVAGRVGLSFSVADAIVAHADHKAIRALLANTSASIRDATLDYLISQARTHLDWHDPLVSRPTLSAKAAAALSKIVTAQLIGKLLARTDLAPETIAAIQAEADRADKAMPASKASSDEELLQACRVLQEAGALDEALVLKTAKRSDRRRVAAQLAVASGVGLPTLDRAMSSRSAKIMISIVWQAGFSMEVAGVAQVLLGQIRPTDTMGAAPGGAFPLSEQEMRWQLDLVSGQILSLDRRSAKTTTQSGMR